MLESGISQPIGTTEIGTMSSGSVMSASEAYSSGTDFDFVHKVLGCLNDNIYKFQEDNTLMIIHNLYYCGDTSQFLVIEPELLSKYFITSTYLSCI